MWSYIAGGVLLVLVIYFIVQGIRCNMAVKESKRRLATYNAQTIALSYGDMTYVDSGKGAVQFIVLLVYFIYLLRMTAHKSERERARKADEKR